MIQSKLSLESKDKPTFCPTCGKTPIAEIAYGLLTKIDVKDINEGSIVLGGCCITDDSPQWHCTHCGQDIQRTKSADYDPTTLVKLGLLKD